MLQIINRIISFTVIIPLIWCVINYKSIKDAKAISLLITASFLTEFSALIALTFFDFILYRIGLIYSAIEIVLISYFFLQSMEFKYKWQVITLTTIIILYFILAYFFSIGGIDIPYAITAIFELILTSIYLLSHSKNILNNWRFTIFFAFFQYNILAIGAFTTIDYIEKHQELLSYYHMLHSSANLLLYVFITIGLIQCKKHFLKVSSLSR